MNDTEDLRAMQAKIYRLRMAETLHDLEESARKRSEAAERPRKPAGQVHAWSREWRSAWPMFLAGVATTTVAMVMAASLLVLLRHLLQT